MTNNANNKMYQSTFHHTLFSIQQCTLCQSNLPLPPRPVIQLHPNARILIIGQAPGLIAHNSNKPWNDPSGDRLRDWLNVSREQFYNAEYFAIMPMGFCYPGKKYAGDAPPRPECAPAWHAKVQALLRPELTILVGRYAQHYYQPQFASITDAINNSSPADNTFVFPHPSGRNNRWLKQNQAALNNQISAVRNKLARILN